MKYMGDIKLVTYQPAYEMNSEPSIISDNS